MIKKVARPVFKNIFSKLYLLYYASQPGLGAARGKILCIFCEAKFFSGDLFRFWSLGYPGVSWPGWRGYTCDKNLPRVGVGDLFSG